ncbi:MAG: ABC transporter ATP-binding protein [Chitinophagaceae bacterium]|nr:ABC transporter ATP-binding protein [Chitinophagaceae bacterium]
MDSDAYIRHCFDDSANYSDIPFQMKHILEADSIQLEFSGKKILSDIYLKCETGNITGLLGRNGSGKSSLLKILFRSLNCENSVRIDGKSINNSPQLSELLRYLPQHHFIPKFLSLKTIFNHFSVDYSIFENRFTEFSTKYKSNMGSLSGGEKRLVEIYLIVKSASLFAMLDEPFTQLSPIQIEGVKELLIEEKLNKGLLLTDHLYQHITDISNSLYLLKDGKTFPIKNIAEIESLGYMPKKT